MTKPQASLSSDADDVPEKVWLAPSVAEHYGCAASYEAPGMLVYVPESHLTTLRAELKIQDEANDILTKRLKEAEKENELLAQQSNEDDIIRKNLRAELEEAKQQIEEWREILQMVNECPFTVDPATVPAIGITEAPPYQVVVVISMAWTKLKLLREALAKYGGRERSEG